MCQVLGFHERQFFVPGFFFPVPVVIFIGVPEEVCDVFLFLFLFSCCDISICVFGAVFICLLL